MTVDKLYLAFSGGLARHGGHLWAVGTDRQQVIRAAVQAWNDAIPDEPKVKARDLRVLEVPITELALEDEFRDAR